jgi:GDP-L-fucose synthase
VTSFFAKHKPEVVIDAAAKVGGILANNNYQSVYNGEHANPK